MGNHHSTSRSQTVRARGRQRSALKLQVTVTWKVHHLNSIVGTNPGWTVISTLHHELGEETIVLLGVDGGEVGPIQPTLHL